MFTLSPLPLLNTVNQGPCQGTCALEGMSGPPTGQQQGVHRAKCPCGTHAPDSNHALGTWDLEFPTQITWNIVRACLNSLLQGGTLLRAKCSLCSMPPN